jgi:ferredoxin-like protein FixX
MSMVVVDFVATLVITRLKQILVSRKKKRNSFFGALCKLDDVWSIEVCPALLFWRMTQSVEVRLGVSCGFCSYISNYGIEADFSFLQKK